MGGSLSATAGRFIRCWRWGCVGNCRREGRKSLAGSEGRIHRLLQMLVFAQNRYKKPLSRQFPSKNHKVAHKVLNWCKKAHYAPLTSKKNERHVLRPGSVISR